jgi:hypothetical protein
MCTDWHDEHKRLLDDLRKAAEREELLEALQDARDLIQTLSWVWLKEPHAARELVARIDSVLAKAERYPRKMEDPHDIDQCTKE